MSGISVEWLEPALKFFTIKPKPASAQNSFLEKELGSGNDTDPTSSVGLSGGCDLEPQNPWCGQFGTQQHIEVAYLVIITVLGVFGNLVVICSILLERKLHKRANLFIVNLAIADFLAAGIYTPVVIANVFVSRSALPLLGCQIFGYLIMAACTASMWNLAFIAINRYVAITHANIFKKCFSRKRSYFLAALTWIISILFPSPTLYGWTTLGYDYKSMVCAWDDNVLSFAIFLISGAILIPLLATIYCYWQLFVNEIHALKLIRSFSKLYRLYQQNTSYLSDA